MLDAYQPALKWLASYWLVLFSFYYKWHTSKGSKNVCKTLIEKRLVEQCETKIENEYEQKKVYQALKKWKTAVSYYTKERKTVMINAVSYLLQVLEGSKYPSMSTG